MGGELLIKTRPETYEIDHHSSIYGDLYIQYGEFLFPHKDWGDLIIGTVTMWLHSLIDLISCKIGDKVEFYFMDGPYYFETEKKTANQLGMAFYSNEKIIFNIELIEIEGLKKQIINTTKQIISFIYLNSEGNAFGDSSRTLESLLYQVI